MSMPIYLMFIGVLLSVEFCFTLKTYLKGAPFYNASACRKSSIRGTRIWKHCFRRVSPVLAKHSKSFSLIDCISVGVDRMQRSFEPMRKQVEAWQRSEL